MANALVTPQVSIKAPVLLTVTMSLFPHSCLDCQGITIAYLDIYTASVLGIIQSKLLRMYLSINDISDTKISKRLCLPIGKYRLAFLFYGVNFEIAASVKFRDIKITEVSCSVDNSQILGEK